MVASSRAVYTFRFNGISFVEHEKITSQNRNSDSTSVAISGDTIVVGQPFERRIGAAYVYQFDGMSFVKVQTLRGTWGHRFGVEVAINDDLIIVGSAISRDLFGRNGIAYVFLRSEDTFLEQRRLSPSDSSPYDIFGSQIAISNDTAIVGAPHQHVDEPGAAYIFKDLSIDLRTPKAGTVNSGAGNATDVLTINGSAGDERRVVQMGTGETFNIDLDSAPHGPAESLYALYCWAGCPSLEPFELRYGSEVIGTFVNATPLHPAAGPQPLRVLMSPELPGALSAGVTRTQGPLRAPFSLPTNGIRTEGTYVFQGLLQDNGADNGVRFSVSNAVILVVE